MGKVTFTRLVAGERVRIVLDVDAVCQLAGLRATRAASGKARLLKGAIVARVERPQRDEGGNR